MVHIVFYAVAQKCSSLAVKVPCFLFYLKHHYACDSQVVALPFVIPGLKTMGEEDHSILQNHLGRGGSKHFAHFKR